MNNFRRILTDIDPKPLLRQIYANKGLWNSDDAWTRASKGTVLYAHENIVLRYDKPEPMTNPNWNKWAFTQLSEAWPIIRRLAVTVEHDIIGNVMISRMQPGEIIQPHTDVTMMTERMNPFMPGFDPNKVKRTPVEPRYKRYQIPLYARQGVDFICGGERLHMTPGEAWWFDNQKEHSVENNSDEVRIAMLADIRSFEFVK